MEFIHNSHLYRITLIRDIFTIVDFWKFEGIEGYRLYKFNILFWALTLEISPPSRKRLRIVK